MSLFLRGLGLVFAIAFFSLARQARGLFGSEGILPIAKLSDFAIVALASLGTLLSVLLALGLLPPLMLLFMLAIYHFFLRHGGDFLSFQWDSMLIEVGLMAFFLSLQTPAPTMMLLATWVFFARFMISAGIVKLRSGDANWRNLSAVKIHYQTQPLPNPVSWHMYQLPMAFHKASTLAMFAVELALPIAIFWGGTPQVAAFVIFAALQLVLIVTGNFSFLNYLVLFLSFVFVPNAWWPQILSRLEFSPGNWGNMIEIVINGIGFLYIMLNLAHLARFFVRSKYLARGLGFFSSWHLCNPYGLFAVMTTKRYEFVIEGSDDGVTWLAYTFRYKPQDLMQAPRQIAPYHPRLDWQMWFAALDPMNEPYWLRRLIKQLLKGSKPVSALLAQNPFGERAPTFIRVVVYDYEFTTRSERKESGAYWKRIGIIVHNPWY